MEFEQQTRPKSTQKTVVETDRDACSNIDIRN